MIKTYKPKALITGWKLGTQFGGKTFVAIPKQHFEKADVAVYYDNRHVMFKRENKPATEQTFKDKFGRGDYTLYYFEWPKKPQTSIK